jgi:tetratricopeptide (TPR) repeat protein
MLKSNWSGYVAVVLSSLLAAGPVYAADGDAPLTTLVDLSADDTVPQEIAAEVLRTLRRSKQVRFRDLDGALHLGGEEMLVSSIKSADGLMKSAAAKVKKKEFDDAVDDYRDAVDNYLNALALLPDQLVLVKAMGQLGAAQWLAGDSKAATATLVRSVQLDQKYEQDFTEYPAGVQKLYDEQRKLVLARPKVDFEVASDPPNARVTVNGKYVGLTPNAYVKSIAGEQFITVQKTGYAREKLIAKVDAAGAPVTVTLQPARRKAVLDDVRDRLGEIFEGSVEADDLTRAEGLTSTPFVVVLRASGTRERMKVELALANLSGRQVVNRLVREIKWQQKQDKEAIEPLLAELLKAPEVQIETGPQVRTKTVLGTWWFWALVAGVAGGSVAAYKIATHQEPVPPTYQPGQGGLLIRF